VALLLEHLELVVVLPAALLALFHLLLHLVQLLLVRLQLVLVVELQRFVLLQGFFQSGLPPIEFVFVGHQYGLQLLQLLLQEVRFLLQFVVLVVAVPQQLFVVLLLGVDLGDFAVVLGGLLVDVELLLLLVAQ
jgi:hypothetical protein